MKCLDFQIPVSQVTGGMSEGGVFSESVDATDSNAFGFGAVAI